MVGVGRQPFVFQGFEGAGPDCPDCPLRTAGWPAGLLAGWPAAGWLAGWPAGWPFGPKSRKSENLLSFFLNQKFPRTINIEKLLIQKKA